jgi:hypothetical protein
MPCKRWAEMLSRNISKRLNHGSTPFVDRMSIVIFAVPADSDDISKLLSEGPRNEESN